MKRSDRLKLSQTGRCRHRTPHLITGLIFGLLLAINPPQPETANARSQTIQRTSNEAQLDVTPPFVIRETYRQGKIAPSNQPGIVGLDMLIQPKRYPLVQGVFRGTPAERQGIRPGDMILAVDGVSTFDKSTTAVDALISDIPGAQVTLTIQRQAKTMPVQLTVMSLDELSKDIRPAFASFLQSP